MERTYTIPLRKEMAKVPKYKHTSKAVKTVRAFLQRHMKNDNVRLGRHLNMELHRNGRKNTPPRIEVRTWTEKVKIKDKEIEIVRADWINAPKEEAKVEETKGKKETIKIPKEDLKKEQALENKDKLKEEVLEHQKVEHGGRHTTDTIVPSEQTKRAGAVAATKETFRRAEKPINEKKK